MKILVGTLHAFENELEECLSAIQAQTHAAADSFVISGKPNKMAHDELYQTFMGRAGEFDLFIKIDADMVLTRQTFFEEVVERFSIRQELGHLLIAVHDWMTDRRIMGMHVYRSSHRWNLGSETYFVDTLDEDRRIEKDLDRLAPAAVHCGNPSPFQAFHFGLHKAVKFTQLARSEINHSQRETHWRHFKCLDRHYRSTKDRRLGFARVGFLHALAHRFDSRHVDYSCTESHSAFEIYSEMGVAELDACARGFGPAGWGLIPFKLRRTFADKLMK
jgi:hypothetical protein